MNRAAVLALITLNLLAGTWSFAVDGVTPSWVIYPLLLLVSLLLLRRNARSALAYLSGIAMLFLLSHVGFLQAATAKTCVHPADSSRTCHPLTWLVTLGAVPGATVLAAGVLWISGGPEHEDRSAA